MDNAASRSGGTKGKVFISIERGTIVTVSWQVMYNLDRKKITEKYQEEPQEKIAWMLSDTER